MSGVKTFTLGGAEYIVPSFTLGEVQRLLPLLKQVVKQEDAETVAGMAALATIVWTAVNRSQPMTFDVFQGITGVTFPELLIARNLIGRAIGYLAEEKPGPGEAAGEESP